MKTTRLIILALLAMAFVSHAQSITNSGWYDASMLTRTPPTVLGGDMMMFSEERSSISANETENNIHEPSTPIAEAVTPDIQALARGLENDPLRIFNYVHDHIRYVHYFGSKKGAQLTLLEKSGNDFDQCALLVALLRAAGQSNVGYQFGFMVFPYDIPDGSHRDLHHWLQLSLNNVNWNATSNLLVDLSFTRGFPTYSADYGNNAFGFHHVWVTLTIGGTTYQLDPSFKVNEYFPGINIYTAMGFNSNSVWSAAAGTETSTYVTNLNEPNLNGLLAGYTTNLVNWIQSNAPNSDVQSLLSGWQIMPSTNTSLPTNLLFTIDDFGGIIPVQSWSNEPTNMMSSLTITFANTNYFWRIPQLQGQRITLTFATNGVAQLWQEDALLRQSTSTDSGNTTQVGLAVDHPVGYWDVNNNDLVDTGDYDASTSAICYQRTNPSTYVIQYAFEPDWGWLQKRQNQLATYRLQGLPSTSREIVSETLNVIGLNWMLQSEAVENILASQFNVLPENYHRLGRVGQENGRGYFVDIYMQLSNQQPGTGIDAVSVANNTRHFAIKDYFSSALEHGVIEQLQSSNLVAASTVKMLEIANTNHQGVYLGYSGNWTTGTPKVRNQLTHYTSTDLSTLDGLINAGYFLLLPQNGSNHIVGGSGTWAGYGFVANGGGQAMGMLIEGNYYGGFSGTQGGADSAYIDQSSQSQPNAFGSTPLGTSNPSAGDPVDMADGTFQTESTDLSLGQSEPRGFKFTRYYNGTRRNSNPVGMAGGWIHNYYANATDVSAPEAGLGATTPAQAAPILAAIGTAIDFHNPFVASPKNWMVTALIAKWGVDQLNHNGVSVTVGKDTLQFIKQPNGTFTPPANCTFTLAKTNSTYWLQERHGNTYKFSSAGLLTNIVDQYGQSLTLTYNSSNWVSQVKDWKNRTLTFNYSGTPSRLTSIADSSSRSVGFGYSTSYNAAGDLTSVTDPESKTNTFVYDTNHQITAIFDAANRLVVTNIYDSSGHIAAQYTQGDTNKMWQVFWSGWQTVTKDPVGARQDYFYDDEGRLAQVRDPMTNNSYILYDGQNHVGLTISPMIEAVSYVYDANQNLTNVIDELGFTNQYVYDSQNNLIRSLDARGNINSYGYNAKFQLTGVTNGSGDWITYTYNTDGTLATRVDPGGTTSYGYDANGYLNSITYPGSLGGESFINNVLGDVTSHTDARSNTTTFQYNNRRQLTVTTAPTNLITSIAYDANGKISSTTDGLGFATSNLWSATGRLLATIQPATPQGIPVTTNVYDSRDLLSRTINPLQRTILYTNDLIGRLASTTDPLLRTTRFSYDKDGRTTATTNAALEGTQQEWDGRGRLTKVTDGQSRTVLRAYDAAGNQIILTNRNGKVWQFKFDAANRLTNTITPLTRETRLTYDNRGLVKTLREPSTQTTTNFYDAKARLTNRVDAVGSTFYGYDGNNNPISVGENGTTNTWAFDAYNQVSSYRDTDGNLIQYRTDASGNLTSLIYPGGKTVTYLYDSLNRLTNVTDWASRTTSIEYDLAGHVTKIIRPNGTIREINYDLAGETTNIVEKTISGAPIAFFKLAFNSAARVDWEFAAPLPHAYTLPNRTMTYDDDNRIATFNSQSIVYDTDGNMTSGPLTNNTLVTYAYDARNRLLSAGGLSYAYDPAGNRIAITNGASVSRFIINPNAPLSQVLIRIKGGVTNYYVYGVGLLYEADDAGNTKTYHYDYRGSTIALSDNNGNVTDRIEYSTYGTITYRAGTSDTPFLFNGRFGVMTDPNGLLYMRARFYNPYLCRFISADPSGFNGGPNFYAYADGNPVSDLDPYGLEPTKADAGTSLIKPYPVGGYIDPFGAWHESFCMSCHDNTPAGNFYKNQAMLANMLDYKVIAYQQLLGFGLSMGLGAVAEDMSAMQQMEELQQLQSLSTVRQYSEADVIAAINRLTAKGISTTEVQSSIDPNQVIRIAQAMDSGAFQNALMDRPVIIDSTTQAILAGHHRIIAAEMTGFDLTVNSVPASVTSPVPLTGVPIQAGRVNPPIIGH